MPRRIITLDWNSNYINVIVQKSVYKGAPTHGGGLIDEGFLKPDSVDQDIRRLREPFIPVLKGLPPTKFIEVFKQKHIRLSTHPRYILYDKKRLLLHEHREVKRLTRKLS